MINENTNIENNKSRVTMLPLGSKRDEPNTLNIDSITEDNQHSNEVKIENCENNGKFDKQGDGDTAHIEIEEDEKLKKFVPVSIFDKSTPIGVRLIKIISYIIVSVALIILCSEIDGKEKVTYLFLCIKTLLFIIFFLLSPYYIWKKVTTRELHLNASRIEMEYVKDFVRIEKRNKEGKLKFGLYNIKKKKVCILAEFDSIEKFDDKTETILLTRQGDKIGLFSLDLSKFIVPVQYTHIKRSKEYEFKASDRNRCTIYDIYGTVLD